jgi:hypothetical protein
MLGEATGSGSPEFFELLRVLRRLQLAGELSVHYKTGSTDAVMLTLGISEAPTPEAAADIARVRSLLELPPAVHDFDVVVGVRNGVPTQIPVVTRSVLSILTDLGGEIAVPAEDIRSGATRPSIGLVGGEARPTIIVHASAKAPGNAYARVGYRSNQFWIDDADFDSKCALTVVQDLMALAEVPDTSHAPVVTVPAH